MYGEVNVCGSRRQSLEQHYHSSVCVWDHTPTYLNVHYHTETLWFMSSLHLLLSPPYLTNHLSLSLSPRLSFSVKVGLISIKQDLSCNPVKWACDGNTTAQGRLTPCESVCVFLFLEKLTSCHLKMFLFDRGNIYGGSVCVCGENISFSPSRYSSSCQWHLTNYVIWENVFENEDENVFDNEYILLLLELVHV